MSQSNRHNVSPYADNNKGGFHGAAFIDRHGREIPITEAMVQKACQSLEDQMQFPVKEDPSATQ